LQPNFVGPSAFCTLSSYKTIAHHPRSPRASSSAQERFFEMEPVPSVQAPNSAGHPAASSAATSDTPSKINGSVQTGSDQSDRTSDTDIPTPQTRGSDKLDIPKPKPKKVKKKDNAGTSETAQPHPDEDSDAQSDGNMLRELQLSVKHREYHLLKERRAKANRQCLQSQLYIQLVNDRLAALETDMNMLLKRGPEESKPKQQTGPKHNLEIQRLSWGDFKVTPIVFDNGTKQPKHVPEIDLTSKAVLEVLIRDPEDNVRRQVQNPNIGAISSTMDPKKNGRPSYPVGSESALIDGGSVSGIPERLRIRSPLLVKMLEQISNAGPLCNSHKHKTVFLRPFKLLVHHADKIRERLHELEDKAENDEALQHLRLLVDFMDRDLAPVWELRHSFEAGELRKVAFPDLWHIFRYGQEVRTPGNKQLQL